jgi:hypothetical protein
MDLGSRGVLISEVLAAEQAMMDLLEAAGQTEALGLWCRYVNLRDLWVEKLRRKWLRKNAKLTLTLVRRENKFVKGQEKFCNLFYKKN